MTTTTWPTRFAVLLVVAMLAPTISACGGGNPGGPDPVPSPSPIPTATFVHIMQVAPAEGAVLPYNGSPADVTAQYAIVGTYEGKLWLMFYFSVDGETPLPNTGRGSGLSQASGTIVYSPRLSDTYRGTIDRTTHIIVRVQMDKSDGTFEVLAQEIKPWVYTFR